MNNDEKIFIDIDKIWADNLLNKIIFKEPLKSVDEFLFFTLSKKGEKSGLERFFSIFETFKSFPQKLIKLFKFHNGLSDDDLKRTYSCQRGPFCKTGLMVTDILPIEKLHPNFLKDYKK